MIPRSRPQAVPGPRGRSGISPLLSLACLLLLVCHISSIESHAASAPTAGPASSQAPASAAPTTTTAAAAAAAAATTTTTTTTTAAPTTTTVGQPSSTAREPSEQEIQEARKLIHEIAATLKDNPNRLVVNKPSLGSASAEFAADSAEARLAEATSQFGLEFLRSLPAASGGGTAARQNVVISPVSLQILLNIILLGTKDQSDTRRELARALGYEQQVATDEQRLKPHAAMHSLLGHIARATHLTIDSSEAQQMQRLLNAASQAQLVAHLQTSARDGQVPLAGQVNFTLANLMLTNSDLVRTSARYEQELKRFYDIKLEHFSRLKPSAMANSGVGVGAGPSAELHERVNAWVRNKTQGQIGSLVDEADLAGGDLAMVLLNAAHFKGRWLHTFNTKLTQERPFYNEGHELGACDAKFMRQNGVFGYGEFGAASERSNGGGGGGNGGNGGSASGARQHTSALSDETLLTEDSATVAPSSSDSGPAAAAPASERAPPADEEQQQMAAEARRFELTAKLNCTALMLPFSLNDGQELSMVVLLPARRDGLADLVASLSGPALSEVFRSLSEQQVQVELPKFSFESAHDARTVLQTMGVTRIFKEGAELERLFAEPANSTAPGGALASVVMPPVKVDKVVHKAKIAVDELGAEAAAASAATIVLRNLIRPPNPSFVADHPFLFVIRHNRSNLPLFMGRVERL